MWLTLQRGRWSWLEKGTGDVWGPGDVKVDEGGDFMDVFAW